MNYEGAKVELLWISTNIRQGLSKCKNGKSCELELLRIFESVEKLKEFI